MKNLKMFCTTLEPGHYELIKKLGYIPVGLGDKSFTMIDPREVARTHGFLKYKL